MSSTRDDEISLLVKDVVVASKLPPKARGTSIKLTINNLTSLIYDRGLLPDALDELISLITTPSLLDQASLSAIVRSLYPVTKVSREVIMLVVSSLGHGKLKPSLSLQAGLLRWLIMVYHVLEAPAALSQAYVVLFNMLDTAAIRPQLTHLLALVTRRKHVRPFRIQYLLNLSRQTGNDPTLVGLLRVFKDYYPEIIVGEAVRGKASAFKHPDPTWRERLDILQEAHIQLTQERMSRPRDGFRVHKVLGRSQRNKALPTVHTSHANEDSVTLEEVENVSGFVQNMDKLELPNQLVAVLADPLLQKLLILRPSAESYQRIANWLAAVLQDVIDGDADDATLWEVLEVVREFVTQTKTLPSLVLDFFARFFTVWDGSGNRECVLNILSYTPCVAFRGRQTHKSTSSILTMLVTKESTDLYKHVFQPLEVAVLDNRPESQLSILRLYTNLLHHWTSLLKSHADIPSHSSSTVSSLIRHTNQLSLTVLQTSPTAATDSAILSFYEQALDLTNDESLKRYIRIELPPTLLVYTMVFSSSLSTVSRLCYILACYKAGFESAMSTRSATRQSSVGANSTIAANDTLSYDRAYVNLYNGFLMDICNLLWRARAFTDQDSNSHGCMIPRPTVAALESYVVAVDKAFSLSSLLSLSHSPVMCLQSIRRVREIEDREMELDETIETRHAGPVTQASLTRLSTSGGIKLGWKEYRIEVLEDLGKKGLDGIGELLKNTMTALKTSVTGRTKKPLVTPYFTKTDMTEE